ncbi:Receptor region transmembrane domain- and RING domain-containing protein 1 [Citrus sinensis]|nr:Receptor region transmembrane domain- and RING domain-containing protein 1 [Citrus sinensis]
MCNVCTSFVPAKALSLSDSSSSKTGCCCCCYCVSAPSQRVVVVVLLRLCSASAGGGSTAAAQVQEESMANAAKIDEFKTKEFDEKMKSKYGQTLRIFIWPSTFASIVWKPLSVHFPDLPAISAFSVADVNGSSICGALHEADPLNGCSPLSNAVVASNETNKTNFVLMIRGQCNFSYKIQNAQAAGYDAAIVYAHRKKSPLIYMTYPEGANVPAFYVTLETGAYSKEHDRGEAGECCIFPLSYAWNKHVEKIIVWGMLLLFVISIPLLFWFARKLYPIDSPRRHRPEQTRQLPRSTVNALPSFVFSSVTSVRCHGRETLCSICLEDYREGENLRVLPCRHEFHSSCVDSWLIRWGTFCPVCRHEIRRSTSNEGNEQLSAELLGSDQTWKTKCLVLYGFGVACIHGLLDIGLMAGISI